MIEMKDAIVSLRSEVCPGCKGPKMARQSVCRKCWSRLGKQSRDNLYLPVGGGYEEALEFALTCLGIVVPYMPGD